jgi:hypothetical protein
MGPAVPLQSRIQADSLPAAKILNQDCTSVVYIIQASRDGLVVLTGLPKIIRAGPGFSSKNSGLLVN